MSADVVIRGGIVVDGSGEPGREADVAITGDRISEIGSGLSGKVELDAGGQVVAPGFIDIHTHYDAQVFWDPALSPSCYHGVTSVIAGNCGFSIAPTRPSHQDLIARTLENVEDMNVDSLAEGIPWDFETFPQYLDSISRRGIALNFGAYIGHTALRLFVVGDEAYERAATDEEVARMVEVVAEAIDAGAAGLATSFAMTHRGADGLPIPSRFATRDEFVALIGVLGQKRRGVVSVAPGDPGGHRRPLHLAAPGGRAVHLRRAFDLPQRQPCAQRRPQPGRLGTGDPGVAPGHPPPAHFPDGDDRSVHPQREPRVRRTDGRGPRRPAQGLRR